MTQASDITHLQDSAQRFVRTEVAPHLEAWEAAQEFPRSLYGRAADLGWLGMGFPEEYGGASCPALDLYPIYIELHTCSLVVDIPRIA